MTVVCNVWDVFSPTDLCLWPCLCRHRHVGLVLSPAVCTDQRVLLIGFWNQLWLWQSQTWWQNLKQTCLKVMKQYKKVLRSKPRRSSWEYWSVLVFMNQHFFYDRHQLPPTVSTYLHCIFSFPNVCHKTKQSTATWWPGPKHCHLVTRGPFH